MDLALAIVFALLVVGVTIDVIRRWPERAARRTDDQCATTQKIIVDLNRR